MESGNCRGDLRSSCYIFVWPFWSKQGSEQSALGLPSKGLGEQQNRALEDHSWLLITQPRAGPQIQGVKILDLVHGWLLDPRGHQQPASVTNYTRADCIHRLPVHPAEAGLELFMWRRGEEKGNISLGLLGWAWHARLLCLFHRGFQRPGMWQLPRTLSCSRQPICAASKTLNQVPEICSSFPGIPLESEPFPARSQKGLRAQFWLW